MTVLPYRNVAIHSALLFIDAQESFHHRSFWNDNGWPSFTDCASHLLKDCVSVESPLFHILHTAPTAQPDWETFPLVGNCAGLDITMAQQLIREKNNDNVIIFDLMKDGPQINEFHTKPSIPKQPDLRLTRQLLHFVP
jgi:hypothetical protein